MENMWLKKINGKEEQVRLFCLPHAGAGGIIYVPWKDALSEKIGLYAVQLPGREKRIGETLASDVFALCEAIVEGIQSELKEPYILFGHSMGGILVYEIMKLIMKKGLPLPEKLIMSASSLKGFENIPDIEHLSDDELSAFLERMGGTQEQLLYNENFRKCYFPIIRNDYRLVRNYQFTPVRIPVPITALAGTEDKEVALENIYYFKELTEECAVYQVKGNHFFIEDTPKICALLNEIILKG